ncbi:MAG: hypothetical protein A3F91_09340 [Flavobacteria bacterium RIFCSPLOWO2_12_FULL_35_11]|nr:MAG: hypothetical protein A3F91_09340 [Flavobacteria bacterium RIFCSPLOWO2_12_FULL_35_11]
MIDTLEDSNLSPQEIDTLEDLKPHLDEINKYRDYLLAADLPDLPLYSNIDSLSEIDSPVNIIDAIKSDINDSAALFESIAITLSEKNHPLEKIITTDGAKREITLGRFSFRKEGHRFWAGYNGGPFSSSSRAEILKASKELLSKTTTGLYAGNMKDEIFDSAENNLKDLTYAMDRAYDKNNKYDYARLFEQRGRIADVISFTLVKVKREISVVESDTEMKTILEEIAGRANARANDIKRDSLVISNLDENSGAAILQNPQRVAIPPEFMSTLGNIRSIKHVELDSNSDLEKVTALLREIEGANIATNEAYTFKVRYLGRHNAYGIYFKEGRNLDGVVENMNQVIVDIRYPFSFIHELTHHIDLTGQIENRDELTYLLGGYNSYDGVPSSKIAYYSNDAELIARAGEVSYTLYQSKFKEVLELLKAQRDGDSETVSSLKKELGVEFDATEENFFEIMAVNSKTSGLSKSLDFYVENRGIYFDLKNRTIEELGHMYSTFQNLLNFEDKIDFIAEKTTLGEFSRENLSRSVSYIKREGLEKYTAEDFFAVSRAIRDGRVTNISLDELIDDYAALENSKRGVKLGWVMGTIANKDQRLRHGFLAIDTYKELYAKGDKVNGYCLYPTIGKDAIVSKEEGEFFEVLARKSGEHSLLGNIFDSASRARIALSMESADFAALLNESSESNVKVFTKDWFFRHMLPQYADIAPDVYTKAKAVFEVIEPKKFESTICGLALSYIRGDKSAHEYGLKLLGIDSNAKSEASSLANMAVLNKWYGIAEAFYDRATEAIFKLELIKFAKNSGVELNGEFKEDIAVVANLTNLRKPLFSKKDLAVILKDCDSEVLSSKIEKYNEDLSLKYDDEYLKKVAYSDYSISRRRINDFKPSKEFLESVKGIENSLKGKKPDVVTGESKKERSSDKGVDRETTLEKSVIDDSAVGAVVGKRADLSVSEKKGKNKELNIKSKSGDVSGGLDFSSLLKSAELKDFTRTDTGESIKIFTIIDKLSKEQFKDFVAYLKKEGIGYYSNIAKGFVINRDKIGLLGESREAEVVVEPVLERVGDIDLAIDKELSIGNPKYAKASTKEEHSNENQDDTIGGMAVLTSSSTISEIDSFFKETVSSFSGDLQAKEILHLRGSYRAFVGDLFAIYDDRAKEAIIKEIYTLKALSEGSVAEIARGCAGETAAVSSRFQKEFGQENLSLNIQ